MTREADVAAQLTADVFATLEYVADAASLGECVLTEVTSLMQRGLRRLAAVSREGLGP